MKNEDFYKKEEKEKPLPLGNGFNYLRFGNASSDNSLKKSYSKIMLIRINKRTSILLRLKML